MRDWLKAVFNLGRICRILLHRTKAIMTGIESIQASTAALSTSVDAAVAALNAPKPDEATLQGLAAQIDIIKARLDLALPAPVSP